MATPDTTLVRKAEPGDAEAIHALVDALADYEKLKRPEADARERLVNDLFGPKPRIECWLALVEGEPAGYAITCETYSSFLALPTLYLEDLFIRPDCRGRGAGLALFTAVRDEAERRGCGRMEWTVLDWNKLAIDFYDRLGARHMKEWLLYRIAFRE